MKPAAAARYGPESQDSLADWLALALGVGGAGHTSVILSDARVARKRSGGRVEGSMHFDGGVAGREKNAWILRLRDGRPWGTRAPLRMTDVWLSTLSNH